MCATCDETLNRGMSVIPAFVRWVSCQSSRSLNLQYSYGISGLGCTVFCRWVVLRVPQKGEARRRPKGRKASLALVSSQTSAEHRAARESSKAGAPQGARIRTLPRPHSNDAFLAHSPNLVRDGLSSKESLLRQMSLRTKSPRQPSCRASNIILH